jgi:hypothetical protein
MAKMRKSKNVLSREILSEVEKCDFLSRRPGPGPGPAPRQEKVWLPSWLQEPGASAAGGARRRGAQSAGGARGRAGAPQPWPGPVARRRRPGAASHGVRCRRRRRPARGAQPGPVARTCRFVTRPAGDAPARASAIHRLGCPGGSRSGPRPAQLGTRQVRIRVRESGPPAGRSLAGGGCPLGPGRSRAASRERRAGAWCPAARGPGRLG